MITTCSFGHCRMEIETLTAQSTGHFAFFRDMAKPFEVSDAAATILPSLRVLTTESSSCGPPGVKFLFSDNTERCNNYSFMFLFKGADPLLCFEIQNKFSFQKDNFRYNSFFFYFVSEFELSGETVTSIFYTSHFDR